MKTNYFLKIFLQGIMCLMTIGNSAYAATFTVTKTADDGSVGTLRWAITQANSTAGYDVINFNILVAGNTFETVGANSWALITLTSGLPVITETVLIDGTTQSNSNTGFVTGYTVGVDAHVQPNINYPDIYIIPGYALPTDKNSTNGNCFSINAVDVTVQGFAISGFGNTDVDQPDGIANADISVVRPTATRTVNAIIRDCFLSCDPRGGNPSPAARVSKGSGILVCGLNNGGTINRNYISHSGGYGIVFHATINNNLPSTNTTARVSSNWNIFDNQVTDIGRSTLFTVASGRAADCISLMFVTNTTVQYNYCADFEQFGIDLGHNTDDNLVENNTVTGFVKTNGSAPCGGIRVGFSSQDDIISKNKIFGNSSSVCLAGIWSDECRTTIAPSTVNNLNYTFIQNEIYNNTGSGITLSRYDGGGVGTVTGVTISRNSTYNNTGLGIDLNYGNTPTSSVTTPAAGNVNINLNDAGDADAGNNNIQNFPLIDSIKTNSYGFITIYGKSPAGATLEFFGTDGGINNFGGRAYNYGEGRYYVGTGVEGSGSDGAAGTNANSLIGVGVADGNSIAAGTYNMFRFTFHYLGAASDIGQITATATLSGNTSEFGPVSISLIVLGCNLIDFSALYNDSYTKLDWKASCDNKFRSFIVERSNDGRNFSAVGEVVPPTGTVGEADFDFTDFHPYEGANYYRLRMLNLDGSSSYSNILRVNTGNSLVSMRVAPNPFVNDVNLSVNLKNDNLVTVKVADMMGRNIMTRQYKGYKGMNVFNVNGVSSLPKGQYIVQVSFDNQNFQEKIIKN